MFWSHSLLSVFLLFRDDEVIAWWTIYHLFRSSLIQLNWQLRLIITIFQVNLCYLVHNFLRLLKVLANCAILLWCWFFKKLMKTEKLCDLIDFLQDFIPDQNVCCRPYWDPNEGSAQNCENTAEGWWCPQEVPNARNAVLLRKLKVRKKVMCLSHNQKTIPFNAVCFIKLIIRGKKES